MWQAPATPRGASRPIPRRILDQPAVLNVTLASLGVLEATPPQLAPQLAHTPTSAICAPPAHACSTADGVVDLTPLLSGGSVALDGIFWSNSSSLQPEAVFAPPGPATAAKDSLLMASAGNGGGDGGEHALPSDPTAAIWHALLALAVRERRTDEGTGGKGAGAGSIGFKSSP